MLNTRSASMKQNRTRTLRYSCGVLLCLLCTFLLHPAAGWGARTVVDQLGRRIELPNDPRRVVSLAPSITEIIFALEQGHRVKGVSLFSDFPPAAKKLPRVGSYIHPDLERIVALGPDLVLATKDGNPRDAVRRIESFGIPVYAVNPHNMATIRESILEIGRVLNASPQAAAVAAAMHARTAAVTARVDRADHRPRVFFQIGIAPIVSIGSTTFTHELIELAGGVNVAAGPLAYPRYSREQLFAMLDSADGGIAEIVAAQKSALRID